MTRWYEIIDHGVKRKRRDEARTLVPVAMEWGIRCFISLANFASLKHKASKGMESSFLNNEIDVYFIRIGHLGMRGILLLIQTYLNKFCP